MKNIILFTGMCICLLTLGCKKDDEDPQVLFLRNEPPLSFDLLDEPDGAENVDVTPTLSWESAKNPKGGEVTYDLYLDENVDPSSLIVSGITDTSFELPERLHLLTDYYWKVVAKDVDGKNSQSAIHKFSTRTLNYPTEPDVVEAEFLARRDANLVAFKDKLWILGGMNDYEVVKDIWSSDNGLDWVLINANADFVSGDGNTAFVFEDKLWVISRPKDGQNTIWNSRDGINWVLISTSLDFSPRKVYSTVVFENKIWVIGGRAGSSVETDVWYSTDGLAWTKATENESFLLRTDHTVAVFQNKLWVIGGRKAGLGTLQKLNDIWYSEDGKEWKQATATPNFSPRDLLSTLVFDDKLWLIGYPGIPGEQDWLWYSKDGFNWTEAKNVPPFISGNNTAVEVFNTKMWLVELHPGNKSNIWSMD